MHVTKQVRVTAVSEGVVIPVWSSNASEKPTPVICNTPRKSRKNAKARRVWLISFGDEPEMGHHA